MAGYHAGYLKDLRSTVEVAGLSTVAAVNGAGVDMLEAGGWDGVVFQLGVGVITDGGTLDFRLQQSANANFSGAVNIADADNSSNTAQITQILNTASNIVVSIDVFRPVNRYIRAVVTPATNNASVSVIAHRYRNQGRTPATLPTNGQYVSIRGM